jgi:hypothetical protein
MGWVVQPIKSNDVKQCRKGQNKVLCRGAVLAISIYGSMRSGTLCFVVMTNFRIHH